MADSCIASNFERRKSIKGDSARSEGFHFLKEGYLHVFVKEEVSVYGTMLRRRFSLKDIAEALTMVSRDQMTDIIVWVHTATTISVNHTVFGNIVELPYINFCSNSH